MADTTDTIVNGLAQGSLIGDLAGNLLRENVPASDRFFGDAADLPRDRDWVKQSFLVTTDDNDEPMLDARQRYNRTLSSADLKFTDASLGGNICINPPPQFTRYADVRRPGIHLQGNSIDPISTAAAPPAYVDIPMSKTAVNYGMGRFYSEAIDDNSQIIHMRFGVPAYNSLTQFFTGFYDSGMATVARTGRISGTFAQRFLSGTGTLIGLAIAPLFIIPLAIMLLGTAARYLMNTPPTKFYYLKPAMPVYWTAVTNMVNQIGTNMGLIAFVDTRQSQSVTAGYKGDAEFRTDGNGRTTQMGIIANYLPDGMVRPDGLIDVKKIACRAKILEQRYQSIIAQAMSAAAPTEPFYVAIQNAVTNLRNNLGSEVPEGFSLENYLEKLITTPSYGSSPDAPSSNGATTTSGATATEKPSNTGATETDLRAAAQKDPSVFSVDGIKKYATEVASYFIANLADGSEFISLRVDYTGSVSESFSNSVADSTLASKINSMSSQNRDIRMNLADGSLIPGMSTIMDAVKDVVGGVAEVLHIDGIAALAGSAFVDIPKHWESSVATLPRSTYTMTLISPYGNPISQMFHIWIPLSMLMCGALPLATGAQSHTSPFLCELHDRGRAMTRLGMIDSLSVERGVSNQGFNNQGHALAVNVSFSVLDLSSIMAVPAMPGFDLLNPLRGIFDSDNAFSDYLMTLASMPLSDVIYRIPMLKYQVNRRIADYKSALSPANVGAALASLPGVNVLSAFMRGVQMP